MDFNRSEYILGIIYDYIIFVYHKNMMNIDVANFFSEKPAKHAILWFNTNNIIIGAPVYGQWIMNVSN